MNETRDPSATPPGGNLDAGHFTGVLDTMWRIRAFEELAVRSLHEGLVLGAIHPSIGQEAVAAGICTNMATDDLLLSTHRGHGHTLAKGADALAMMRELFGREGGTCGGKGGSMHIADFDVGMLGANGVVAANISIAAGAAHALKLRGETRVVVCIFGDGAINRGPFLEGLNWAKVFDLPVLFVCEDNGFSATTRTDVVTAGPGPVARAESLGLPAQFVGGNDVVAIDAAARAHLEALRRGEGPRLIHCRTYRMTGHTAADKAAYRSPEEVEAWRKCDPIEMIEDMLRIAGVSDERIEQARVRAYEEMETIVSTARDTGWPDASAAFTDVQDLGDPRLRPFS